MKTRIARYTVTVTTLVPPDKEEIWDDTVDVVRVALHHIALDNTEYHFPNVIVEVEP